MLVQLALTRPQAVTTKSQGDVTLIHDEATGELTAFNLFNASTYVETEAVGEVELTEEVASQMQDALLKNGVEIKLECRFHSEVCYRTCFEKRKASEC